MSVKRISGYQLSGEVQMIDWFCQSVLFAMSNGACQLFRPKMNWATLISSVECGGAKRWVTSYSIAPRSFSTRRCWAFEYSTVKANKARDDPP